MLPMRSGYDILNAIARQPSGLRLPVIFLTARSTNTDMARALAAGVADYIVKPFVPSELAMRVNLALNRELDAQAA
jgi:DNA-binding response OmpR family regulator